MSSAPHPVTVRLFAAARAAAGIEALSVPAGSVDEVLHAAIRQAPGLAEVLPRCSLLVDGLVVHDTAMAVEPGAALDVLPPFAGG